MRQLRFGIVYGMLAAAAVLGECMLARTAVAAGAAAAGVPGRHGEYLLRVAGCTACHTADGAENAEPLAGGHVFDTPYGVFRSPNITPHPDHGIGRWSLEDFERALTRGVAPDGSDYYPVFPYTSYTRMRARDVRDLFTYLQTLDPVDRPSEPHALPWYMRWRFFNWLWKLVFFTPGPEAVPVGHTDTWARGAYIARALAHCSECHSPRGLGGAVDTGRYLGGNPHGPDGGYVPNLTRHASAKVSAWSARDLTAYLGSGELPDGDYAGGSMAEVIDAGLAHLTPADMGALVDYLLSLPPLPSTPRAE